MLYVGLTYHVLSKVYLENPEFHNTYVNLLKFLQYNFHLHNTVPTHNPATRNREHPIWPFFFSKVLLPQTCLLQMFYHKVISNQPVHYHQ